MWRLLLLENWYDAFHSEGMKTKITLLQFACLVRVPTEVLKQKMQTRFSGSSMLHVGRVILSAEGYRGFYSGFSVTLLREVVVFAAARQL